MWCSISFRTEMLGFFHEETQHIRGLERCLHSWKWRTNHRLHLLEALVHHQETRRWNLFSCLFWQFWSGLDDEMWQITQYKSCQGVNVLYWMTIVFLVLILNTLHSTIKTKHFFYCWNNRSGSSWEIWLSGKHFNAIIKTGPIDLFPIFQMENETQMEAHRCTNELLFGCHWTLLA